MNRVFLIIGVGLLIAALVVLNQGIKKASPTDQELQQQQEQAQKAAQATPPPPAAPPKPTTSVTSAVLPAEETVGNPGTAKHHILVGWVYNETIAAYPQILNQWLSEIRGFVQKSGGAASAEIVNVDVPAEDRSPAARAVTGVGMSMDGKTLISMNLSDMRLTPNTITGILTAAIRKK